MAVKTSSNSTPVERTIIDISGLEPTIIDISRLESTTAQPNSPSTKEPAPSLQDAHSKHDVKSSTVNVLIHSITKNVNLPTTTPLNYDVDWRKTLTWAKHDGYEMIVLPKKTTLYCGVSVHTKDGIIPKKQHFYGSLNTALYYAFCGEMHRGQYGKVIVLQTTRELVLLDVTQTSNFKRIGQQFTAETKTEERDRQAQMRMLGVMDGDIYPGVSDKIPYYSTGMTALDYCFRGGVCRTSQSMMDAIASVWIAKNINGDGWALDTMYRGATAGKASSHLWHDEVFVKAPINSLVRLDTEFRATKQGTIVLTENGVAKQTFSSAELSGLLFKGVYNSSPYQGQVDKHSDKFLFDPTFIKCL